MKRTLKKADADKIRANLRSSKRKLRSVKLVLGSLTLRAQVHSVDNFGRLVLQVREVQEKAKKGPESPTLEEAAEAGTGEFEGEEHLGPNARPH